MEKELNKIQGHKYIATGHMENLFFITELLKKSHKITLYGDLEIEPYTEFSLQFQAEYWYLKYMLVINKGIVFEEEDVDKKFFSEEKINIIWLNITDGTDFILECKDGVMYFIFKNINNEVGVILSNIFKLEKI